MAKKFKVTERTIRYDLEEINSFFTNRNISILFRIKDGNITVIGDAYDKSKAITLIKGMNLDFNEYILCPKERKYLILIELFFAEDFITIKYLADKTSVSRNTIINDLYDVKDWLIENDINPIFMASKGLYIEGEEKSIRHLGLKAFREALSLEQYIGLIQNNSYRNSSSNNYSNILLNYLFNNISIEEIQKYINAIQEELNIMFSNLIYIDLIVYLAMAIQRIKLGNTIYIGEKEKLEISNTNVYRKVNLICNNICKHFDINFNIDELIYISQLILANNSSPTSIIEDYPNLLDNKTLTTNLIAEVGKRLNSNLTKDDELYDDLYTFILPFSYRQKYQIQVYNPYLNEIKSNYTKIFAVVKSSILLLKQDIAGLINDDEIGYMTLYFAAVLENQNKLNILVLYGVEYSIANLLSTKLKLIFNVNVVGIASINEAPKMLDKHKVDLIVTTYAFISRDIPCIVVNPLLNQEDILLIRKYVRKCRAKKIGSMY